MIDWIPFDENIWPAGTKIGQRLLIHTSKGEVWSGRGLSTLDEEFFVLPFSVIRFDEVTHFAYINQPEEETK